MKAGASISKVYEFLVYPKTFSVPENIYHEKRIGIADREVTIAFPLNDENGSTGKIFAYLPINSNINLPLLINADFILTSSRENIQINPWNQWLSKCVAELIGETLEGLKKYGYLTVEFLEKLASGILSLDEKDFLYPIVGAMHNAFKTKEFLPADDGTFVFAQAAKLARGADLRNLLNQNQLHLLFESINTINWLTREITQDRTPDLRTYLMQELNVEEITPENFARKITESFLTEQSDNWFVNLYQFLANHKDLWKPKRGDWDDEGILRSKPIIRLQNGEHVKPFKDNRNTNAYLTKVEETTSLPIVKIEIAQQEEAFQFLQKHLEIPELDIVEDVIVNVVSKYSANKVSPSSLEEHKRDMQLIRQAYKTDSQKKKRRLEETLLGAILFR